MIHCHFRKLVEFALSYLTSHQIFKGTPMLRGLILPESHLKSVKEKVAGCYLPFLNIKIDYGQKSNRIPVIS